MLIGSVIAAIEEDDTIQKIQGDVEYENASLGINEDVKQKATMGISSIKKFKFYVLQNSIFARQIC